MRSKAYLVVLALIAAGLATFRACGSEPDLEVGVTPELAGIWQTTSPGYTDRYIEIGAQRLVFGLGEEGEATHPILGVVRTSEPGGGARYVLRYGLDATADSEGRFEVLVGSEGLRIASQPGILWTAER